MSGKSLEGSTVQLHESLTDNRFHLTVTTLHVHHHGDGHTTSHPLVSRSSSVLHDSHVTSLAIGNQLGCGSTEGIAIVSVEVRRSGAASLITEEVMEAENLPEYLPAFFIRSSF